MAPYQLLNIKHSNMKFQFRYGNKIDCKHSIYTFAFLQYNVDTTSNLSDR